MSGYILACICVAGAVFGMTIMGCRAIEGQACTSIPGNSYDMSSGVCIWPPMENGIEWLELKGGMSLDEVILFARSRGATL